MKHLVVIVAFLAACGSKSGPDCATSIGKGMDNFAEQMKAKAPSMPAMADMVGKLKDTLVKRCTEDKWPAEVLTCFTTVSDRPGMQQCQQKLTDEQREKLMADIRQMMMGNMKMPGGMAGHPPMLGGSATPPAEPPPAVTPPAPPGTGSAQ